MDASASSSGSALRRPRQLRLAIAVAGLLLLSVAGYYIFAHFGGRPRSPAQVKRQIAQFLEKQTGRDTFVTAIPAGLTNELVAGRRRGNEKERDERGRRRNNDQLPPLKALGEHRKRLESAGDYKSIYIVIGEELWMADKLLASPNTLEQQAGLLVAAQAERAALSHAVSPWLAARIAEAYLWPGLPLAENSEIRGLNADTLLQVSDNAFQEAGETNNIIRNYQYLIGKSGNPNRADMARVRLAGVYEDMGNLKKALELLTKVQNTNNNFVQRRIDGLRHRIKQQ